MRSSAKWAAEFVDQLFRLIHRQWTYWNKYLHYRAHDGAETVTEFESRMKRIEQSFEHTDPEDLLEEDRHLLEQFSLEELAAATTETRLIWDEEMKSAHASAFFENMRRMLDETECENAAELQGPFFWPPPERDKRPCRRSREEPQEEN